MNKHTYRPDMKSAVECVMRRLADRPFGMDATFDVGDRATGNPTPAILGVADLASVVGGASESYRFRFDPTDDRADVYRPMLVYGDRAVAVDVFVRRAGARGEA